jgi:hypothetical protein
MILKIHITTQHIRNGTRESPTSCPIALAVREQLQLKESQWVEVDDYQICLNDAAYYLSPKACKFVENFDSNKPVKPFSFNAVKQKPI